MKRSKSKKSTLKKSTVNLKGGDQTVKLVSSRSGSVARKTSMKNAETQKVRPSSAPARMQRTTPAKKKENPPKTYHTDRIHPQTKLELFYKMLEKGLTNVRDIPTDNKFEILDPNDKILGLFKKTLSEKSLEIDEDDNIIPIYFVTFRIMYVEGSADQIKVLKTLQQILINIIKQHKSKDGNSDLYHPYPENPTIIQEPDNRNVIKYRIAIKGENGKEPTDQFQLLLKELNKNTKLKHLFTSGNSAVTGEKYVIELNFDGAQLKKQLKEFSEEQKRRADEFQEKKQADERKQLALAKEQAIEKIEEIHKKQEDKLERISDKKPKRKSTPNKSTSAKR